LQKRMRMKGLIDQHGVHWKTQESNSKARTQTRQKCSQRTSREAMKAAPTGTIKQSFFAQFPRPRVTHTHTTQLVSILDNMSRGQKRFSLLLLEEHEQYFCDAAVSLFMPPAQPAEQPRLGPRPTSVPYAVLCVCSPHHVGSTFSPVFYLSELAIGGK
jgi:hypothetical protein